MKCVLKRLIPWLQESGALPTPRMAMSGDLETLGTFPQSPPSPQPSAGAENKLAPSRKLWTRHREYEFAVEVTAGPPDSVFCHTKV